jgi:hypothetical protein
MFLPLYINPKLNLDSFKIGGQQTNFEAIFETTI